MQYNKVPFQKLFRNSSIEFPVHTIRRCEPRTCATHNSAAKHAARTSLASGLAPFQSVRCCLLCCRSNWRIAFSLPWNTELIRLCGSLWKSPLQKNPAPLSTQQHTHTHTFVSLLFTSSASAFASLRHSNNNNKTHAQHPQNSHPVRLRFQRKSSTHPHIHLPHARSLVRLLYAVNHRPPVFFETPPPPFSAWAFHAITFESDIQCLGVRVPFVSVRACVFVCVIPVTCTSHVKIHNLSSQWNRRAHLAVHLYLSAIWLTSVWVVSADAFDTHPFLGVRVFLCTNLQSAIHI